MSYSFTAYFNDPGIANTHIYCSVGVAYDRAYGDDYLYVSGFTGYSVFTATPADGYEFYRWVYRVGSVTASVQYSYSQSFTYEEEQDIYIRAESTGGGSVDPDPDPGEEEWELETGTFGTISATTRKYIYLNEYTLYRYAVKFAYDGEATFYTNGSFDTMGFLSYTSGYDEEYGEPTSYFAYDDDSGTDTNFSITVDVTAGTTYYIFVRAYDPETTGQLDLYIEPPSGEGAYGSGGFYVFNGNTWVKTIPYVYNGSKWVQMKPCLYTSAGWYEGI